MHGVDLEAAKATSLEKRVTFFNLLHLISIRVFSDQVPFLELSGILEDQFSEYTDSFTRFACTILCAILPFLITYRNCALFQYNLDDHSP